MPGERKQEFSQDRKKISEMLSFRIKYAIQILVELQQASHEGRRLSVTELRHDCGFERQGMTAVMCRLRRAGWVGNTSDRQKLLVDLDKLTLYDVALAMDEDFTIGPSLVDGWPLRNRHKIRAAIMLDGELTEEFKEKLKKIRLTELFTHVGDRMQPGESVKGYKRKQEKQLTV